MFSLMVLLVPHMGSFRSASGAIGEWGLPASEIPFLSLASIQDLFTFSLPARTLM